MALSFWQRRDRAPTVACDAAVVGGGLVGASTAYWLCRRRPSWHVVLLEAGSLAEGASGRNAGFLLQGASSCYHTDLQRHGATRARRLLRFTRKNRNLIAAELDGRAFDLQPTGSLTVAGTEEEDERLRQSATRLRQEDVEAKYLTPPALNERLGGRGFYGGLFLPDGAMLDPQALVQHVARRSGATVLQHHRVEALAPSSNGAAVLETLRRPLRANRVALALNAYLPLLYPALGDFVRPVRAQMLMTNPLPHWLKVPVYSHEGYFYIRQTTTGHVLLGGARHLHRQAEVGYSTAPTPALQHDLEVYLTDHFPHASEAEVIARWAGTMGFSPDGCPSIGPVPDLPGSYWVTGSSGRGLAYGFHLGRLLAERMTGQNSPPGNDLFATDRFDATAEQA